MRKLFKVVFLFVFIIIIMFFSVRFINNQTEDQLEDIKPEDTKNIIAENNNYIVYEKDNRVLVSDNNKEKITEVFSSDEYSFQKLVGETIYYTVNPSFGDTTLTLKSMNTSGTQNKVIKIISLEKIDVKDDHSIPEIIQFELDDNNFYITYGYYKDKTTEIQDADVIVFNKEDTQKELVLEGYSHFEFIEKDSKKYITVTSNVDGKNSKIINVENYEEVQI